MNRDELVELLLSKYDPRRPDMDLFDNPQTFLEWQEESKQYWLAFFRNVLEEAEPLIRADEREREATRNAPAVVHLLLAAEGHRARLADLRAKVEVLQAQPFAQVGASGWDSISRADVLALLDGGSDDA